MKVLLIKMISNRKTYTYALTMWNILFLNILLLLLTSNKVIANDLELNISYILPLSGEWAFLGEGVRDAAILAKEDINDPLLNINFHDNRGELSESSLIANSMKGKTDVIVSIISGVVKVIKPIAIKNNIIQIGICSDTSLADAKNTFLNYLTKEEAVDAYLKEFLKRYPENTSLGIFYQNESGFVSLENLLKTKGKIPILFSESFNGGELDFRSLIAKSLNKKPDTLLLLGLSPSLEALGKQIRVLNKNIPLTSIESFALLNDNSVFKGAWFIDASSLDPNFSSNYKRRFERSPSPGSWHSYKTVNVLYSAFTSIKKKGLREGRTKTELISEYLRDEGIGIDGVLRSGARTGIVP